MSADGLERRVVVEIAPTIDSAGTKQTFLFAERGFATTPADSPSEVVVRELLQSAGQWQQDLFGGSRMGGRVVPGGGTITLINEGGVLDAWVDYGVDGAKVTMRWGPPGAAYPAGYSTVLIAYGLSVQAGFSTVQITLRDRLYLLDKPISSGTFSGTGGFDGTGVAGQRMQWVAGDPGYVPPILLDASRQLYFVQDAATGGIQDYRFSVPSDETITAPFDTYVGGVRLTRGANYASAAECLSTAPGANEVRFWFGDTGGFGANKLGPVYMRLGTTPTFKVRVYAAGYAPDGAGWFINDVVQRAGLSVPTYYGTGESVRSRLVNDDSTYLEVLDDSCIADLSAYGFTRLDELYSVRLQEPANAATVVYRTTDTGTDTVTRPLFTFTISNARGFTRGPVAGMPTPIHRVTVTSGEAWPHELDPTCTARMREALQRETAWASFTGENPAILDAHPGAQSVELVTKERYFQNQFGESLWVMNYLTLFGGLRWIMTLEADMTDTTLAIELMDNALVDIPRFGCTGGRAFRVVSRTINVDARTITFGLWGGTPGLGGYLVTTTGGAPTVVNPAADLGRLGDIGLLAYSHAACPSWAFPEIGAIGLIALSSAAAGGGTSTTSFTNSNVSVEFSQSGVLNQFNPALGTLTAATLTVTVHAIVSGDVTRDATAGSFTINQIIDIDCGLTSDLTSLDALISGAAITLSMSGAPFSMAPSTTHTFFSSTAGSLTSSPISLASILADLIGTGTFQIFGASATGVSTSGLHIASSTHSESAGFDASITYTYT